MSNDAIETYEHLGYTIEIHTDDDPLNPRKEWDQAGTMVCWHRRYGLGDKHSYADSEALFKELAGDEFVEKEEATLDEEADRLIEKYGHTDAYLKALAEHEKIARTNIVNKANESHVILPLFLYDHSGITMSTGSFSCPWDSGQVGFIFMSLEKAKEEQLVDADGNVDRDKVKERLESEVKEYASYLEGEVYGYIVKDEDGNDLDSCWGFLGDIDYCKQEAQSVAKSYANDLSMFQGAGI